MGFNGLKTFKRELDTLIGVAIERKVASRISACLIMLFVDARSMFLEHGECDQEHWTKKAYVVCPLLDEDQTPFTWVSSLVALHWQLDLFAARPGFVCTFPSRAASECLNLKLTRPPKFLVICNLQVQRKNK